MDVEAKPSAAEDVMAGHGGDALRGGRDDPQRVHHVASRGSARAGQRPTPRLL